MKKSLICLSCGLLLTGLVACGGKELSGPEKFCKAAIEDVFLPQHKLSIDTISTKQDGSDTIVIVHYSIVDVTGKQVEDIGTCRFDNKTGEKNGIKSIHQFGNYVPEQHVAFLNKRIFKKMGMEDPATTNVVVPAPITDTIAPGPGTVSVEPKVIAPPQDAQPTPSPQAEPAESPAEAPKQ